MIGLESAALTHPGLRRAVNEDSLLARDPVFLVADGMGGHESGDRASRAAIEAFSGVFGATPDGAPTPQIEAVLDRARAAVAGISAQTERGAGCTLTGAIRTSVDGVPHWYLLNIGDSRVYLQRGSELVQVTRDHSLQEELRAEGSSDAARVSRNVITRALGSLDSRHDAWMVPIENGTRMLICSDGLTTEVSDADLLAVLAMGGRAEATAEELVRRACAAGGRDNISVVIVDVVSGGTGSDAQGEADDEDELDRTIERTRPGVRANPSLSERS